MKVTVNIFHPDRLKETTLIAGIFKDFEKFQAGDIPQGFEAQLEILRDQDKSDFEGNQNESFVMFSSIGIKSRHPKRLVLAGLGKPDEYSYETIRNSFGSIGNLCCEKEYTSIGLSLPVFKGSKLSRKDGISNSYTAVIEGLLLGAYRFNKFKSKNDKKDFNFENITVYARNKSDLAQIRKGLNYAMASSEVTSLARDLSNTPANFLTPSDLVSESRKVAREYNLKIQVISGKQLVQKKLNGILAVGKGSTNPPHLIILEYMHPSLKSRKGGTEPIVFIGKAVTFDSGGISLKPGANMHLMKHDMSGGAAVIGSMAGMAKLKLPVHAVGLVPAVENLPSGSATKPGDIIHYRNGKTIEVLNTDAEGRLILADALAYAEQYNPGVVVDVATLTGACVVALGSHAAGLMGNNEKLLKTIENVSELTGERVWKLPLWKNYQKELKADTADIKNIATREGGAITAAAFLLEFAENYNWAHIDIAGTAWTEKGGTYKPKGATGFGSRLLLNLAKQIHEQKLKF
jgi:leucyl aminopeptidase